MSTSNVAQKIKDLEFDAIRNAIYHGARRGFLDFLNKVLSFVVILSGATAVGDFGAKLGFGSVQFYAFIAAIAGALQLVFDFGGRAQAHAYLQRRYHELSAKMVEVPDPTPEQSASWDAELRRIYSEEPPPMRALDAIAYNAACESLGKHSGRVRVTWYQSLFRHFYPFNQSDFPYEHARAKSASPSA
jgi:hypothetical protein